jgi:ribosomal-protein-alanine N-acetyltransferase
LRPQIRKAIKEDLDALLHLEEICFKEERFNRKQLGYLLNKAKSYVVVASIRDTIVGSIIILLKHKIRSARVYSLNVHPEYRRISVASLLMDSSLGFLKNGGFKNVTLETGINNRAALCLYLARGFSVDNLLKHYYENGGDALHLIKKL